MVRVLSIAVAATAFVFSLARFNGPPDTVFAQTEVCGDPNGDESVNIVDAVMSLNMASGNLDGSDTQRRLADLNRNARVDIGDINRIVANAVGAAAIPETCGPDSLAPFETNPLLIEPAFGTLTFDELTNFARPNDGGNSVFVTEQRSGLIHVFPNRHDVTDDEASVFLDIRGRLKSSLGNEEGLLGLAFDPGYMNNGFFYVLYSAGPPRHTVLSRFSVSPDNPVEADPDSELIILEVPIPLPNNSNHNGGQLAFGPDGYLYIAVGDGGGSGDPGGNGQNPATLLGTILRIDVHGASDGKNYALPADNPFVNDPNALDEIWAYGLRNPWRFSFEPETGLLWAGDVGQSQWEEVDIIKKGANYGWNVMEGPACFQSQDCDQTGLELPIHPYEHDPGGCAGSITGGFVYQGQRIPQLTGAYIYGDFCTGQVWGLRYDGENIVENVQISAMPPFSLVSFGEDLDGNLYLLSRNDGIYRFAVPQ